MHIVHEDQEDLFKKYFLNFDTQLYFKDFKIVVKLGLHWLLQLGCAVEQWYYGCYGC